MMPKRPAATALRRRALAALVITERHRAGLRQLDVARILGRPQSWVARIESDDRLRVDVIEFVALAAAIGFDPVKAVSRLLQRARARRSQRLHHDVCAGVGSASFHAYPQRDTVLLRPNWDAEEAIQLSPRAVGQGNPWLACSARGHVEGRKGALGCRQTPNVPFRSKT